MKAKLTFDLNDVDDSMDHLKCVYANDMASFIWELQHNTLRKALKDGLDGNELVQLIYEQIVLLPFDIDELVR